MAARYVTGSADDGRVGRDRQHVPGARAHVRCRPTRQARPSARGGGPGHSSPGWRRQRLRRGGAISRGGGAGSAGGGAGSPRRRAGSGAACRVGGVVAAERNGRARRGVDGQAQDVAAAVVADRVELLGG